MSASFFSALSLYPALSSACSSVMYISMVMVCCSLRCPFLGLWIRLHRRLCPTASGLSPLSLSDVFLVVPSSRPLIRRLLVCSGQFSCSRFGGVRLLPYLAISFGYCLAVPAAPRSLFAPSSPSPSLFRPPSFVWPPLLLHTAVAPSGHFGCRPANSGRHCCLAVSGSVGVVGLLGRYLAISLLDCFTGLVRPSSHYLAAPTTPANVRVFRPVSRHSGIFLSIRPLLLFVRIWTSFIRLLLFGRPRSGCRKGHLNLSHCMVADIPISFWFTGSHSSS